MFWFRKYLRWSHNGMIFFTFEMSVCPSWVNSSLMRAEHLTMTHLFVLLFHRSMVAVILWPRDFFTAKFSDSFDSWRKSLKSGSFLTLGCLARRFRYRSRSRHRSPESFCFNFESGFLIDKRKRKGLVWWIWKKGVNVLKFYLRILPSQTSLQSKLGMNRKFYIRKTLNQQNACKHLTSESPKFALTNAPAEAVCLWVRFDFCWYRLDFAARRWRRQYDALGCVSATEMMRWDWHW